MSNEKIYFTSDMHIGHANVIRYSNRPFKDVHEMDEALIANWNATVPKNGIVYSLGDFSFARIERVMEVLEQLNGNIIMVGGNHDHEIWKNRHKLLASGLVKEITPYKEIRVQGQFICLFHYGCRVWNKSHHGSWLLYGHSHDSLPPLGKSVDVGVDSTAILGKAVYRPFTFQEVKAFMDAREAHEQVSKRKE